MAGTLEQVIIGAASAGQALADIVMPVKSSIGDGITIQVLIDEEITNTLEVTEHPVEEGPEISDHSYLKPVGLTLRCGWSNSSATALLGAAAALFGGGNALASNYVEGVYGQLKALQETRQPFTVTTQSGQFENMLMTSLARTREAHTSFTLNVTATFREIILVSTQSTTLPAQSDQADPASTSEQQSVGVLAPTAAQPAPGGSFDFSGQ